MSFLQALYLLGGLAAAVPIYLHLRRRPPSESVEFGSIMFLEGTPAPRVRRRARPEQIGLLVLRCLAVGLLALAFARPFFSRDSAGAAGGPAAKVILLDSSASMGRDGIWDRALEVAREELAASEAVESLAVWRFDHAVDAVVGFDEWGSRTPGERGDFVAAALASLAPGGGGSDLATAMTAAAEELVALGSGGEVVVIGDLQEGARTAGLESYPWPSDVSVRLRSVDEDFAGNAWIERVPVGEADDDAAPRELVIRVVNDQSSDRSEFRVSAAVPAGAGASTAGDGDGVDPIAVTVAPGEARVVRVPVPAAAMGGELVLEGDAVAFDNRLPWAAPRRFESTLALAGTAPGAGVRPADDPHWFLERALVGSPQRDFRWTSIDGTAWSPAVAEEADGGPPASSGAVDGFSADGFVVVGAVSAAEVEHVASAVREEGVPALVVAEDPAVAELLEALWPGSGISVQSAVVRDYELLGTIDFEHPVMAPFREPGVRDFSRIRFWAHGRIAWSSSADDALDVVAAFDSGDPALIVGRAGAGRVAVLASGWTPRSSQLALSSKFVPLVHSVFEWLGIEGGEGGTRARVGEPIAFPVSTAVEGPLEVGVGPGGAEVDRTGGGGPAVEVAAGATWVADRPGLYRAVPADGDPYLLAVELPAAESRLAPSGPERWRSFGIPLAEGPGESEASSEAVSTGSSDEERARHEAIRVTEGRQKLWRWIIVALVVILLVESILAGRRRGDRTTDSQPEPVSS